jgi:hypothetical protein
MAMYPSNQTVLVTMAMYPGNHGNVT